MQKIEIEKISTRNSHYTKNLGIKIYYKISKPVESRDISTINFFYLNITIVTYNAEYTGRTFGNMNIKLKQYLR